MTDLTQPQSSLQCTAKWAAICTELGQLSSPQHPSFPLSVSFLITDSFASSGGLSLTFTAIQLLLCPLQKIGNTVHILYLSSTSDSLSCSLQYMAGKLFQLKKASTSNHFGICPTCNAQFFDTEGSKRRVRRRWWWGRRCFHHKQMDYSPWCTLFNRLAVFNLA